MGRWLLPLDPLGQDHGGPGVSAGGFDGAGGTSRSSVSSVCGPEVPEMNLPQKSSAQPIQLMQLLKKRGVLCQGDFTDRAEVTFINGCDFFSTRSCCDLNVYIFR